ncbi:hypothetical protein KI387_002966, partial [Taxus chinensis]
MQLQPFILFPLYGRTKIEPSGQGAIRPLVDLMADSSIGMVDKATVVLGNLANLPEGKIVIVDEGGIPALVEVVEVGSQRGKEYATATLLQLCEDSYLYCTLENSVTALLNLSLFENNKSEITSAGAIKPLIHDAAITLYTLSFLRENKDRAIRAGAIRPLVDLMADSSIGMVDKAAVVLGNLTNLPEGEIVIVDEGGIPVLVEVVEVGSQRGKEYATVTLLQICEDSYLYHTLVLREGAIPPLVALS